MRGYRFLLDRRGFDIYLGYWVWGGDIRFVVYFVGDIRGFLGSYSLGLVFDWGDLGENF